ncbi:MAG TPA: hypothetical protein VEZ11_06510 [Thermoanaerobaculia bacterium]|nr:hypothetical protein [Thermoanaerobaculia bacterium]
MSSTPSQDPAPARSGEAARSGSRPVVIAASFAFSLLGAALFALSIVDAIRGQWDHDGGFYLLRAAYVASGLTPYRDYLSIYPPLYDLMNAVPVALIRDRVALAVALPAIWIAAGCVVSFAMVRAFTGRTLAALAAAAMFPVFCIANEGTHVTLEHGVIVFTSLALIFARRGGVASMAACGACAFGAIASKQNGATVVLPIAIMLWARRSEVSRRHLLGLAIGAAAPAIAMLAWLRFDFAAIAANVVGDLQKYTEASQQGLTSLPGEWARSAPTVLFLGGAILCGVALTIARGAPNRLLIFSLLVCALAQLAPRLLRNYPHYDLNAWPYAILLVALAAARLFPQGAPGRTVAAFAATLLVAAIATCLPQYQRYWSRPGLVETAFIPSARLIRAVSNPGTPIRQYGTEPIIEFLSGRLPEELSLPRSVYRTWSTSGIYPDPAPPPGVPVVLVDTGQRWMPAKRADLLRRGYQTQFRGGTAQEMVEVMTR